MELIDKNWLWLEQIAAKATCNHQSTLAHAKSIQYPNEQPTSEEVIANVRTIISSQDRYILLPQMMPGREQTRSFMKE